MEISRVNRVAFEKIAKDLDNGECLTFDMIGEVFQQDFWIMLVGSLMDARDAARYIQSALNHLRQDSQLN